MPVQGEVFRRTEGAAERMIEASRQIRTRPKLRFQKHVAFRTSRRALESFEISA